MPDEVISMAQSSAELKERFKHLSKKPQSPTADNPFGHSEHYIAINKAWNEEQREANQAKR